MFTSIIILMPFLMIAFLPISLKSFSSDELDQMGVQLDDSGTLSDPFPGSNCILLGMNVVCAST